MPCVSFINTPPDIGNQHPDATPSTILIKCGPNDLSAVQLIIDYRFSGRNMISSFSLFTVSRVWLVMAWGTQTRKLPFTFTTLTLAL